MGPNTAQQHKDNGFDADAAPVLIVGGGPVGLLLALRLEQLGIRAIVLERDLAPRAHSRSIGIHPPSLRLLDELGVLPALLAGGVQVPAGQARADHDTLLGRLSFSGLAPYPYMLVSPQDRTEAVLAAALAERGTLRRGVVVTEVLNDGDGVRVTLAGGEKLLGSVVVGCDGKDSLVRQAALIPVAGGAYDQTFVMGDADDVTDYGPEAVLFLAATGLVESFPLPRGRRRWVASTATFEREDPAGALVGLVHERTGWELRGDELYMHSAFGVQHLLAQTFARGRVALAGDAAHVCSPIGGQGMNLGWLDAWDLAAVIQAGASEHALAGYTSRRRHAAGVGIKRAERNMRLGIGGSFKGLRNLAVRLALRSPATGLLARVFTMDGLSSV